MSASLKLVEKIGDVVYADQGIDKNTKKNVDDLIIKLNEVFLTTISQIEDYHGRR